jgi:hypothetical protein
MYKTASFNESYFLEGEGIEELGRYCDMLTYF